MLAQWFIPADCPSGSFITSWTAGAIDKLRGADRQRFIEILATMGQQSAEAQGLRQVLTSYTKLQAADTRVYIAAQRDAQVVRVVGILKMGSKNLFVRTQNAQFRELQPLCCLDFYVHFSCQRCGIGRLMFEAMLQAEQTPPHKIAYDRPSPKLIGFLAKHYGLKSFTPQENNYVVFHKYFEDDRSEGPTTRRRRGEPPPARPAPALLTVSSAAAAPKPHRGSGTRQHSSYDCNGRRVQPPMDQDRPAQHDAPSRLKQPSTNRAPRSQAPSVSTSGADQNTENDCPEQRSPVRGLRGLQGMSRENSEARAKIPVLPQGIDAVTPSLGGYQSARSRRSGKSGSGQGNFLHHSPNNTQRSNRDEYQAACQQRKASWWG